MAGASSSSGGSFRYDVFINFRGEDTRRCFICHLYKALEQKALDVFIDSEELRTGDDLSALFKAIEDSRLSIVVFSRHYASSTWCLKELVHILDRRSQIVVPIFYQVNPSHICNLEESFAEAFAEHESNSKIDKEELESWKSSLNRAANISGYHSTNFGDDTQLIDSIVKDILEKLIHISPSKTDGLIGMDSHINAIDRLLQLGVDDFPIVGIWGMGGIGKSTIAKAFFDRIAHQFEHKCFLDNVKEGFITKNGAVQMVEKLLSKLLKVKDRSTLDGGLNMIRERLGKKRILLVLDDVDNLDQIETLIGEKPTFGGGSRIIITTRDKKLLAGYLIYEPKLFTNEEALALFSKYAFRTNKPSESYDAIARRAVKYAYGLPLALKVLGALLDNKSVQEWEYELEKIKKVSITSLDNNIGRVLWASYDGLDEYQKKIFLDIACFFKRMDKDLVTKFHESCGFFPQNGLRVLEERSLVSVSRYGELEMHDLIQEVGRDIVHRQSTEDPGMRSRLWNYEDVHLVLAQNTATKVEGIILDLSKLKAVYINDEVFVSMSRLRLLQLSEYHYGDGYKYHYGWQQKHAYGSARTREADYEPCVQDMNENLKFLSNELRVLVWHGCPLKSFPINFVPNNLIYIDMCSSHIKQLWEGTKRLQNLVYINLSHSKYLIETPDFTEATHLKQLRLGECTSLLEVHPSISALKSLVELDLRGCSNLNKFPNISGNMEKLSKLWLDQTAITEIPSSINDLSGLRDLSLACCRELRSLPSSIHMKSLNKLDLSGCSKLTEFPEISKVMEVLRVLPLEGTAIKELPSSINNLTRLQSLSLRNCTSLVCLPNNIGNMTCLQYLCLTGCRELRGLPSSIHMKSLKSLDLSGFSKLTEFLEISEVMEELKVLRLDGTAIKELPSSINNLTGLVDLYMSNCTSLVCLPENICNMACLQYLCLTGCSNLSKLPENFGNLKSLYRYELKGSGIKQLPFSILCRSSLLCNGCKEMTEPFSSWPTWNHQNPSYSVLIYLDLSDCNLLEISDGIAHLSSLQTLKLCRNENLESLPAAMNRLGHLTLLYLRGLKRLKSIPELSSSIQDIEAHNCTSLETVSTPQPPYAEFICFQFFNCFKLVNNTNIFINIVESATRNQDYYKCRMTLPGSDIPDWFNHQSGGLSVTVPLPPNWLASNFLGFGICAISNLRGADNRKTLESTTCCCTLKANDGQDNFYFPLLPPFRGGTDVPLELDHMLLGYTNFRSLGEWHNERKYTEATFRIVAEDYGVIREDWEDCTWITSCGVRLFHMNPTNVGGQRAEPLRRVNRRRVLLPSLRLSRLRLRHQPRKLQALHSVVDPTPSNRGPRRPRHSSRLHQRDQLSTDLICNLENRETEIRSKRRRKH
ncbi:putative TIR domain, winged helix-turn-helix DNA-binding domain-containing protein [Rosa chinensis]|uniref:ADP-ribosyl cyclase/cyclic ADP-ribose hydrolase n=1 Tax=Rosa chinensis TaxID=74649 RepID=A0A2P6SFS2_ROSCH|nr:disease resistance protein RPV1 [Rosa chinensis]XP_024170274.1 disease resistance protein RPV1 [Rosa chinensis]XP_040370417.1 disease resistance protein RPV1 [Rosa chinensis]XP_040370418.1 disease resistance protein RPV1 [Rosa chinensis]XP_040370424.1 disease resistance protein RPV1 [Rosa chinensis]XP_040370429.1 disease resistance protein RPV1 [Rosa chinensis]XP_040370430.1 disease resistance protein RPV1 [Rosa chinensis]XP_040370432.1 disease resistance protein RPV1 [Rosa chinensis]XP_